MTGAGEGMGVCRRHSMPFGAQVLDEGGVRFRIWAPKAQRVEVSLREGSVERLFPMSGEGEGWFGTVVDTAGDGSRYLFVIDGRHRVPDPASRYQPEDVHGPSEVVDPERWCWSDGDWAGRPWEEAVLYELHVGTFTPEGTFAAARRKLDHLTGLGVTAVQLMPVAEFPGARGWGYDGVLPFSPESAYGSPDDLKAFVQAAHAKGLMVLLDVVYNHFGPEGNYLHLYAPAFFTSRHHTPWGDAIDFEGEGGPWVRQFFIHNALYWLEEFHLDGLRLDAVHALFDDSAPGFLEELADEVCGRIGQGRQIHLVLENDNNAAHYLECHGPGGIKRYAAQWNDDFHHALHVLLTGETRSYYADYASCPLRHLGRSLCEGFAYQGEKSGYRKGKPRGEPSRHLPATAFVGFLQNHDQAGNRPFGERIAALAPESALMAATALLLLAPSPPLLFMGQEWGSRQPFLFFCDFGPDLSASVTEGRRREFAGFPEFADEAARDLMPDPSAPATFRSSRLDWETADTPEGCRWLSLHRELLALRRREIVPRLAGLGRNEAEFSVGGRTLSARWRLGDGARLCLLANLSAEPAGCPELPQGRMLFAVPGAMDAGRLPPWSVVWVLGEA